MMQNKEMNKRILYRISRYGFKKIVVYVVKDNGDRTSLVSRHEDGSFPELVWNCNLHNQ